MSWGEERHIPWSIGRWYKGTRVKGGWLGVGGGAWNSEAGDVVGHHYTC